MPESTKELNDKSLMVMDGCIRNCFKAYGITDIHFPDFLENFDEVFDPDCIRFPIDLCTHPLVIHLDLQARLYPETYNRPLQSFLESLEEYNIAKTALYAKRFGITYHVGAYGRKYSRDGKEDVLVEGFEEAHMNYTLQLVHYLQEIARFRQERKKKICYSTRVSGKLFLLDSRRDDEDDDGKVDGEGGVEAEAEHDDAKREDRKCGNIVGADDEEEGVKKATKKLLDPADWKLELLGLVECLRLAIITLAFWRTTL